MICFADSKCRTGAALLGSGFSTARVLTLFLVPSRCSSISLMAVQPPISTIPCIYLYSLANPVLPFSMFSWPTTSPTNGSPLLRSFSVPSFSSPEVRSFNFKLSTACPAPSRRVNFLSLSPLLATLPDQSQLTENPATLSPFAATLTSRVKSNPFVCHSYKKTPGWGYPFPA